MARRLAAILAIDVVGYSRLMTQDEAGTLDVLKTVRRELLDPKAAQYGGRIIKLMGDGALIEFASAVDAVSYAVEVQSAMGERDGESAAGQRFAFRIGINIGDVIVEGDDLYGGGVNLAARLEGLAEPGGICLSLNVYEQVRNKLDLTFELVGERAVKNICEPVTVYRIACDDRAAALVTPVVPAGTAARRQRWLPAAAIAFAVALAGGGAFLWTLRTTHPGTVADTTKAAPSKARPAIAVLPFANISAEKEQEYFADGMTEDLITDLSKIKSLMVVSRASTSDYRGTENDVRQIGKALNVQYVVEGSVRKAGDQVRINAQLIDAATGGHVWAQRYDGKLDDIFGLQDRVLSKIIGSLALELSEEERKRLAAKGTDSVAAYNLYLRGLYEESRFTREGYREATHYYEQALAIDPNYALPYTGIANILELSTRNGWSADIRGDLKKAVELASRAVQLDPQNPKVYWSLGRATARLRTPDALKRGIAALQRAIDLNPDFADAYAYLTVLYVGEGRAEDGLRSMKTAMRLNPNYPFWYLFLRGIARFVTEDYPAAITDFEAAVERNPTALFLRWWLAAAYAQAGRQDDAEWQVVEMESMGFDSNITTIIETQPIQDPGYLEIYSEALRKAGIPD